MPETKQTHIVLKIADCQKYLNPSEYQEFAGMVEKVATGRQADGKNIADYLIVNSDEPYFEKLHRQVLIEETKKRG